MDTPVADLPSHPLAVVTPCRARNLPVLALAYEKMRALFPFKRLHVITARRNFRRFERVLGTEVALVDEDTMIPGMTLDSLKVIPQPFLARGPGWYFQQLLKFQFAFIEPEDDYYLIWDADTVPLRPMRFFDESGRMLFAIVDPLHQPYFATYEKLLGEAPKPEYSFITQHMIVKKSLLREMLSAIEQHCPGEENWAWKIMRNLGGDGYKRFSEYETYGHYVRNRHPDLAVFRRLPWSLNGTKLVGPNPTRADLDRLPADNDFVSFEAHQIWYRERARQIRHKLRSIFER